MWAAAAVALGLLVRWLVGQQGYSGEGCSPKFGDFEAQRHWMEVVWHLPVGEWYTNTTNNDLQYWGLDYPPLTAYWSWVWALVAQAVDPALVELHASRGLESLALKLFMRTSVIVSDALVLFPACWLLSRCVSRARHQSYQVLAASLLCPALILVDHGHFQVRDPRARH